MAVEEYSCVEASLDVPIGEILPGFFSDRSLSERSGELSRVLSLSPMFSSDDKFATPC